jgi:hypothetical protein
MEKTDKPSLVGFPEKPSQLSVVELVRREQLESGEERE